MHSSSSKTEGRSKASTSSASSSREIPGFYFDERTGRYYSLENAPPAYRKQVAEKRAKEENELTLKRFKESKMFFKVNQKRKSSTLLKTNSSSSCPHPLPFHPPTTFIGALYRRESGLLPHGYRNHHGQHFMEPLSDLFSARLGLNDHHQRTQNERNVLSKAMPIENHQEYSQWKSSFSIRQIRGTRPNSFIMGPFHIKRYSDNHCYFIKVAPEKVSKIKYCSQNLYLQLSFFLATTGR